MMGFWIFIGGLLAGNLVTIAVLSLLKMAAGPTRMDNSIDGDFDAYGRKVRRYRYEFIPRKNGKTLMGAGLMNTEVRCPMCDARFLLSEDCSKRINNE